MRKIVKGLFWVSSALVFFALFFHSNDQFDQDLGRHLFMGKYILSIGSVPKINLFSYTNENFPFINTHWLSEVIFYLSGNFFGIESLTYLTTILMVIALLGTVYVAYRISHNLTAVAVALAVMTPVLLERTEARPEIFSYFFCFLFMGAALIYIQKFSTPSIRKINRLIYLLPLVQILWVNSHIYFILGPIIWGLVVFSIITHAFLHTGKINWQELRPPTIVLILIILASLFNSWGIAGALYPFNVFNNYGYAIAENQNIFYLESLVFNPNIFYFKIIFVIYVLSYFTRRYSLSIITLFTLFLFPLSLLSIMAIRSLPFFFLLNFSSLVLNFANFNPQIYSLVLKYIKWEKDKILTVIIFVVILLNLVRFSRLVTNDYYRSIEKTTRFGVSVISHGKPGVDFILSHNLHGPIFNNFDVGGYLDYRLFPKEKVFVDNRPEAYPARFFNGIYYPMQATIENFQTVAKLYGFNLVVYDHLDHDEHFLGMLNKDKDWQLVYLDNYLTVFVRKEVYPEIAQKYAVTEDNFKYTSSHYFDNVLLARVCYLLGWDNKATKYLQTALQINPDSLSALSVLGTAYSSNPTSSLAGAQLLQKYKDRLSSIWF